MASVSKRTWTTAKGEERSGWECYYRDNQGKRCRKLFTTKRDADRFRIDIENRLLHGTFRPHADKMIVRELCGKFIEHCEERLRRDERMTRKHLTVMRGHIFNWILNEQFGIGSLKLNQVSVRAVSRLRDNIRDQKIAVSTTRKILQTLHACLEYAISQDWLVINVAASVKVLGTRDEKSNRVTPPTKESLQQIVSRANYIPQVRIVFASTTGLRASEQWALRWSGMDFDNGEVRVRQRVDSYGEIGPPKSAAGVRDIPVSDYVLRMMREWKLGSSFSDNDDLVFPNKHGRYLGHDNFVKRVYKPLLREMQVEVGWHALRHFAISTWIEQGAQPKQCQTWAGHASLETTMTRYGHLFKSETHKQLMNRVSNELFQGE